MIAVIPDDAVWNKAKGQDADFDKALMQNLTMSGLGTLTGKFGDAFLENNKAWAEALEQSGKNGMFRELVGKTKDGDAILRSDQIRRFIAQTAGATPDASMKKHEKISALVKSFLSSIAATISMSSKTA